jgi:hypothetical protein
MPWRAQLCLDDRVRTLGLGAARGVDEDGVGVARNCEAMGLEPARELARFLVEVAREPLEQAARVLSSSTSIRMRQSSLAMARA